VKRLWVILGITVGLVVVLGCVYVVRNPERATLDASTRQGAPGRFVRLSDGVTHYDISGPDSGRTVLLVHGFSVPYYIWDSTATALSGAGYRVVRYDEYGRGLSDRPDVEYNAELYDRQLGELLDSLKITDKIDLAGVSMGGSVTGVFAGRHPDRVRSLMLFDPVAGTTAKSQGMFDWPIVGAYLWQTLAVPTMAAGQASDFAEPARFPDWADRYREQMRYHGFGRALLSSRRARLGMTMDSVYERVAKSALPVLLVWGKVDRTVPFSLSDGVRRNIPSAEFHAIDGAAHLAILEKAQETDSLILAFLAKQPR
jgi:pimeloyl-ACP methyl ester carboxylesterase